MRITARYDGTCRATGARILAGDVIDYSGGRAVLIERRAPRVDVIQFGSRAAPEYYRNARGRCEDAPCCGCCTI